MSAATSRFVLRGALIGVAIIICGTSCLAPARAQTPTRSAAARATAARSSAARHARGGWLPFNLTPQTPHPAVVRIRATERNAMSQGSGTLVAVNQQHGLVVTNWHVVRDAQGPIVVTFPDGFQSAATVMTTDENWDLAALLIWKPKVAPIPIARQMPRPGELLTIAGYGAGTYRAATGRCTQYVAPGVEFPYEMVELSAEARQGDSGGPILNERGELAGVLFGAAGGTTSGSYCGRVRKFLAAIWPDVEQAPDEVYVSAPASNAATQWPTADVLRQVPDHAARTVIVNPSPQTPAGQSSSPQRPVAAAPIAHDVSRPRHGASGIDWQKLVGSTPLDQSKSILATIGILGIFIQFTRLVTGSKDS